MHYTEVYFSPQNEFGVNPDSSNYYVINNIFWSQLQFHSKISLSCWMEKASKISHKFKKYQKFILSVQCVKPRGLCKKKQTNVFLHSIFNTYNYAFLCLYTQSRHFDNSKMVNWVNLVQKLTKIQGKMQKFKLRKILVFCLKTVIL